MRGRKRARVAPAEQKPMKQLLQAIVDNDLKTVRRILDSNSSLLLIDPRTLGITTVENQRETSFIAEKPFTLAQRGGLLEMTAMLLPYFDKLPHGHQTALDQWVLSEEQQALNERQRLEYKQTLEGLFALPNTKYMASLELFKSGFSSEDDGLLDTYRQ